MTVTLSSGNLQRNVWKLSTNLHFSFDLTNSCFCYFLQWEKTKASQDMRLSQQAAVLQSRQLIYSNGQAASTYPLELSTLV